MEAKGTEQGVIAFLDNLKIGIEVGNIVLNQGHMEIGDGEYVKEWKALATYELDAAIDLIRSLDRRYPDKQREGEEGRRVDSLREKTHAAILKMLDTIANDGATPMERELAIKALPCLWAMYNRIAGD